MKQRNPDARCENCPYARMYDEAKPGGVMGRCYRRPPAVDGKEDNFWPHIFKGDWCGEHPEFFLPERDGAARWSSADFLKYCLEGADPESPVTLLAKMRDTIAKPLAAAADRVVNDCFIRATQGEPRP